MDSAAAYSMVLPDEGRPRWAGFAFAGRCIVSLDGGLYKFTVFSVSGSGTVTFDFGDGTTHDVVFPEGANSLDGEIVDGKRAPLFSHSYSADGEYTVTATSNLTGMTLAGRYQTGDKNKRYDTGNTAVDTASALHDVWRCAFGPAVNDLIGWGNVDVAVIDGSKFAWQNPWFNYDSGTGEILFINEMPGPKKVIARGIDQANMFDFVSIGLFPTFCVFNLEEFYAPSLRSFGCDNVHGPSAVGETPSSPPFSACDRLRVVYVPMLNGIRNRLFVSPRAAGVRIYTGRLTEIHSEAFGYDGDAANVPNFTYTGHGNVELFCQNTRQEILNLAGYPFGADYLKCHCTDVTFDNRGRYWRNSDGRPVDSEGRLVDDDGRLIDESWHLIAYDSDFGVWRWVDAYGYWVDGEDRPIDLRTGFWVDRDRHVCDEHGRRCDTLGNLIASLRYWSGGEWVELMPGEKEVVVDRIGTSVGIVRLKTYEHDPADPRHGRYASPGADGYAADYFDDRGFLVAREAEDGTLYTVEYVGDRRWYVVLYSEPEAPGEEAP